MLSALLIIFREVIEAGLIVGIVLAATAGVPRRSTFVALGVLGGVIGACLVALFAGELASLFQGSGQELFNAAILFLAVHTDVVTSIALGQILAGRDEIEAGSGGQLGPEPFRA